MTKKHPITCCCLRSFAVFLLSFNALFAQVHTGAPKESVYGREAMVVTAHPDATAIGLAILKQGGNAFDAAVAVEFALAVCFPVAGNIGGGGFALFRLADGQLGAIDYREKAPLAAHREFFWGADGQAEPHRSQHGHQAAGVPGTVAGMAALHARYGQLPWETVVQPAVELAARGVALTPQEAARLNRYREAFEQYNTRPPYLAERVWQAGDTLHHHDLAATLIRIREDGHEGFYGGTTADLIVAEMQRGGGLITHEDLRQYRPVWRTPLVDTWEDYRFVSMSPPSSGGLLLLQLWRMIRPYGLARYGFHHPYTVQVMVEAERRAYADRSEYMGDGDFYPVPVHNLLDSGYLMRRMQSFDSLHATPSTAIKAGYFTTPGSEETTHYSLVDPAGNALSVTTTLNGAFGSKVVVAGAGFLLNNEMDDFSIKPGVPNMYGAVGGEANAVAPGKRPLSSMTPTIVEKAGALYMVVGTPGGTTIPTSVFQVTANVLLFGMGMQEAINAPRFHHQWLPDVVFVEEEAFSPSTRQRLTDRGYILQNREPIGRVEGILRLPDGRLEGAADPRGDDTAAGF